MAKTSDRVRKTGKFLRSMLSKEVFIREIHTKPDNVKTESPVLASRLGPYGNVKWYEAIPMSNQEASTVAKVFVNVCVSRFGCPANLHSNKGSNFMSNRMCKELGINRTSPTAYLPQGE